jgi:hypothetical protein
VKEEKERALAHCHLEEAEKEVFDTVIAFMAKERRIQENPFGRT